MAKQRLDGFRASGLQGFWGLGFGNMLIMLQSLRFRGLTGIYIRLRRGFLPSLQKKTTSVRPLFCTKCSGLSSMLVHSLKTGQDPEEAYSSGSRDTPSPAGTSIFGAGLFGAGNLPLAAQGGSKGPRFLLRLLWLRCAEHWPRRGEDHWGFQGYMYFGCRIDLGIGCEEGQGFEVSLGASGYMGLGFGCAGAFDIRTSLGIRHRV